MTKTFGEPVEKVLFVFDGTQAPDINALTAQVGGAGQRDGSCSGGRLFGSSRAALRQLVCSSALFPPGLSCPFAFRSLRR